MAWLVESTVCPVWKVHFAVSMAPGSRAQAANSPVLQLDAWRRALLSGESAASIRDRSLFDRDVQHIQLQPSLGQRLLQLIFRRFHRLLRLCRLHNDSGGNAIGMGRDRHMQRPQMIGSQPESQFSLSIG